MDSEQIRVGLVFNKTNPFLMGDHFDNTYYNFFIKALQRNPKIKMIYFPTDDLFDATILNDVVDVILLWNNAKFGMPCKINGLRKSNLQIGRAHV